MYASIAIDSVKTTASTCANNGTITIYAQSGYTMLYAITAGPNTRPPQNSDAFASLPAGTYTLQVTDLNNDTAIHTVTVSGTYTSPAFSPTFTNPECPAAATGVIVGNPQNAGTPPFTWVLTDLTTNVTTTQSSDSFRGLSTGSYSLREYDSCGNFATYSITLTAPSDSFSIYNIINGLIPCDSVRLIISLFVLNGNYAPPYTIQIQDPNGTYQHTITDLIYSGAYPHFYEDVPDVGYGDYINVTITDACGRTVHANNTVADFDVGINFVALADSCSLKYYADFFLNADTGQTNVNITDFPDPVLVIVSNATTGAVIDTVINNDTLNHFSEYAYSEALTTNQDYTVKIIDGCGHVHVQTYTWPPTPPPTTLTSIIAVSCMDSTACVEIQWQNTFFSDPTFHLISGPGHIGSSAPHYVYSDTIIYPQSYLCTGNTNGYFIELTNLAAGTYHYSVVDSCGNTINDSFTITNHDLNVDHFTANYIKGCPGQNVIAVSNDAFSYATLSGPSVSYRTLTSPADTLINLNYGTYIATFHYEQTTYSRPVNLNPVCQLIIDTIYIPPYVAPEVSYADQISCHGSVYVIFSPDSTTGIAPYKYEILSGPQTTGTQSSNIFTLTLPGAYVARITDSCDYANTFDFTVDTLSFAEVARSGSSCIGSTTILSNQYSPYASYIWQLPGGGTYYGDSLYIDPVTSADFGTYIIDKIVSINGCTDTFHGAYVFAGDTVTQTTAGICPGQSIAFGGILRTAAGVYYDTIVTSGCDSIVALNLTIRSAIYDSVVQTICAGQTVTVGPHTYAAAGIYYDTFVTAGCDSIHILDLHITPYGAGSAAVTICPGQSFIFGSRTLSQAGIYYDTLATAGCDSIVTLTLSVRGPLYDSVSENICPGQSVTVGLHTYSTTGLYRDTIATAGCDSVHVLNLNVGSLHYAALSQVICPGQSYLFGGVPRTVAGLYYDTIPTSACDSIVALTLSVRGPLYDSVVQTICAGQSIVLGARTYGSTGIYRDTIPTSGCDSIYVVNLQVLPYIRSSVSANICPGQSFVYGANNYTATGTYEDTVTASAGCDTVVTIHLTVLTPVQHTKDTTGICALTYNAQVYTSDATLTDTITSMLGCDSVYQSVQIIIRPPADTVINNAVCIYAGQSYTIGGQVLTTPGIYSDTLRTASGGCDSLITRTDLHVITPQYVHQRLDSCFSATIAGVTYTRDTVIGDTILSDCGLDSIIGVDTLHFFDPSVAIITASQLPVVSGNPVRLYLSPAGSYYNVVWSPDSAISSIFAPSPTVSPINNTTYYVTAEDSNHCPVAAQILITVTGADLPDFLIPTAFSPNGDGLNDIYRPILKSENVEVIDFQIFDRWGQKVFDKNLTGTFGWDGTCKNEKQPLGVYIYFITVKGTSGQQVSQSGNVTLIR